MRLEFIHIVISIIILNFLMTDLSFGQGYKHHVDHITINHEQYTQQINIEEKTNTIFVHSDRYYYWYKSNKVHYTEGGQGGRLLHGEYVEYYQDNSLKCVGQFRHGLRVGKWRYWYSSGIIMREVSYRHGRETGICMEYDKTGKLYKLIRYRKGKLHGAQISYLDNVKTIRYYKKGIEVVKKEKEEVLPSSETESQTDSKQERKRIQSIVRKRKANNETSN